jgi:hypothetical protein
VSNVFSYNKKTSGEGWIPLSGQYGTDEIESISDPNGGLTDKPRTAIPSPFAQMDLVKNAFNRLSADKHLRGAAMDERLVANALDVAQLFFNYAEVKNSLKIVEWDRESDLSAMETSSQHRLLGETIDMFLEQDKEAFNFDKMKHLYFLVGGGKVIGSTSPVTLFMASPNAKKGMFDVPIEENVMLFDSWRPLYLRDTAFVKCLYALFTAYPDLKKWCGEMNNYIIRCFPLLDASLQSEILGEIGNPSTYDEPSTERAKLFLDTTYDHVDGGVESLNIPFYCIRKESIETAVSESDFVIAPSRKVEDRLPLVLQNRLSASTSETFKYITRKWDDSVTITPSDYAMDPDKRILPATNHPYPWLTDDDFFEPALIKLDYTMDAARFFDGNLSSASRNADNNNFLLPLKPLFFKYFEMSDLWGTIGGRPRFEMIHNKEGQSETLTAILRIPVKKQGAAITLTRTYVSARNVDLTYDYKSNRGYLITLPFALSIFPFIRIKHHDHYNVQLVDRALGLLENYSIELSFKNYERETKDPVVRIRSLKAEKRVGSAYYELYDDFDYISVSLYDERHVLAVKGIVCPRWQLYIAGHEAYTFAVDFGTTNTHVESMRGTDTPIPFVMANSGHSRMQATLYNGESILYDVILKQEFLPKEIGADYGFPQRTVISECERMDAQTVDNIIALGDANIPFIYEKESTGYGNRIVPNLKWSTEMANSKRIKAFLTEIIQMMRTKVLLENGDIYKTRIVWFYPLAMKVGNIRKLSDMWAKTFADVFNIEVNDSNLIQMPESVAPYYYYKCSSSFHGSASTVCSIDIGGGSSDVAVFGSNSSKPTLLTSFRFAANVLFGDAFSEIPQGDNNPMVIKYEEYFRNLFNNDDDRYGELIGILDDIKAKRKSEDINAFLFSVFNNKAVGENDVFSYDLRLNEDGTRKIIFIYFYTAIIYYVANMMRFHKIEKPRSVMFSGTGSKILDIVGSQREIDILTQQIFEGIYGERYLEDGFSVIMERKEPKQITCRGALMQVRDEKGCESVSELNKIMDGINSTLKCQFSMIEKEELTYDDMQDENITSKLLDQVDKFNDFFIHLCDDVQIIDRFLVDAKAYNMFKNIVGKELKHYLISGWNFMNKNNKDKNGSDLIEDAVFFYPIIGSIRNNLIEKLV